jgi:hypothetical protein
MKVSELEDSTGELLSEKDSLVARLAQEATPEFVKGATTMYLHPVMPPPGKVVYVIVNGRVTVASVPASALPKPPPTDISSEDLSDSLRLVIETWGPNSAYPGWECRTYIQR